LLGYDSAYFSVASSDKYRINFAMSAFKYMETFGFDGLDIDWEYPNIEHCDEDVPLSVLPNF
jgi:chitinase